MDLEELNKSQIVLLTLLVSFVTSIATGIVSVTLMEQAPPAITQTVNRIVERTVEKVVPLEGVVAGAAVTEQVITLQESDLVTAAVEKTTPIAVRLFAQAPDQHGQPIEIFLGIGVVASSDGLIFADASMMTDETDVLVQRSDGIRVHATVIGRDTASGIVRLQAAVTTEIEKDGVRETQPLAWTPATFIQSAARLGETVVVLAGKSSLKIADGIVTALPLGTDAASNIIETSISNESFVVGSPLITVNGEVLGIATVGSRATSGGFLASTIVLSYNTEVATSDSE
jgi:S1-C subfamily serine protease